ncbi:MAG: penicillin-binding protein 2 [Cellulomonas sp.]|nr:penicillin-binding protein 2 [Cellulomonas sp.]
MAPLLEMDAAELGGKLVGTSHYKYLKKGVLPAVARQIAALRIDGINVEQTAERVYPNGTLAGDIIGFTNSSGHGLQGLESSLDSKLSGTPGELTYERGGNGQAIPGGYRSGEAATDGQTVQLTIRDDVQWKAQDAITKAVKDTGADSAQIVVMRPNGELLAIADSSTIDPNAPGKGSAGALLSAVSDVFEPGSTGKVVTMSAALETGTVTATSQFQIPDTYAVGNQIFHDAETHGLLNLTTTGILAESSNVGTVQIGQKMSAQTQYDFMTKFGFGSKTGIEVPGESSGILHPVGEWDGRTRYNVLFGQGVAVTAVQAASVYATIANHGVRVTPHLIKAWTSADGTITGAAAATSTQVVSAQTAATVTTMLESVVDDGTGGAAAVDGYQVAGKTGTAQDISTGGTTASFIGFAPADDPQVVVAVILKNPKTSIYGGVVAAPVFAGVTSYALTALGVSPSGTAATLFPTTW